MPLPIEGTKKIVGIVGPCGTEEVTVTGGKLDVNAVVAPVPPTPVVDSSSLAPFTNVIPFLFPFIPGAQHKIIAVAMAFAGLTPGASITVTITFTFAAGPAFDTVVVTETLVADALGKASFFAEFNDDRAIGDGYIVAATTASVAPGGTAAAVISTQ